MSDEFYKCGACGYEDGGARTEYEINIKKQHEDIATEVLGFEVSEKKYIYVNDDKLDQLENKGVEFDIINEIEICVECENKYIGICFARTD